MSKRLFVVVIFVVLLVFAFSTQTAPVSVALSRLVSKELVALGLDFHVVKDIANPTVTELYQVDSIVRNYAHVVLYGFVALAIVTTLYLKRIKIYWAVTCTLLFVGVLAAVDENVQGFIPGRGSELRDWLSDMLGATIAIVVFMVIIGLFHLYQLSRGRN